MKTEQLYRLFKDSAGVTTDSRNIKEGQIFFALRGDNFDGNRFASDALKRGASLAVIDNPEYEGDHTIAVQDCLTELQALATHYRKALGIPLLAITGSNGKTTTKELIASVVSRKLRIHYTTGNLNNHIGVPLTILAASPDTEMLIVEMGANHIGEIKALCRIAAPDYGIITNIGTAHIEGFGSFEGVVKAKTELYEYLQTVNGIALYNDSNPILKEKIAATGTRAVPFSAPDGNRLQIVSLPSEMNLKVEVSYLDHTNIINTSLFGAYNLENIIAAVATGILFGVGMEDIAAALHDYKPSNNRSQVRKTARNTLICDSYNANPSSMKEALRSFGALNDRSKALILGDMLELGEKSVEEHMRVLQIVRSLNITNVFLVGKIFSSLADDYGYKIFPDVNKLMEYLKSESLSGFTILLKGSRGIGLEKSYDLL